MKKIFLAGFFGVLVLLVLSGCVSAPLEQRYPERFEKTSAGMSLEEFKAVWPDAQYNGYGTDQEEIYSYVPLSSYVSLSPKMIFFIFKDGRLTRYFER
jgi:hypothetical protein